MSRQNPLTPAEVKAITQRAAERMAGPLTSMNALKRAELERLFEAVPVYLAPLKSLSPEMSEVIACLEESAARGLQALRGGLSPPPASGEEQAPSEHAVRQYQHYAIFHELPFMVFLLSVRLRMMQGLGAVMYTAQHPQIAQGWFGLNSNMHVPDAPDHRRLASRYEQALEAANRSFQAQAQDLEVIVAHAWTTLKLMTGENGVFAASLTRIVAEMLKEMSGKERDAKSGGE